MFVLLTLLEDVDPSVGRFRNMVTTAVVPIKVTSQISSFCLMQKKKREIGLHVYVLLFVYPTEEENGRRQCAGNRGIRDPTHARVPFARWTLQRPSPCQS